MIPCDHVIAKLWEYVDGDLDELRSERVRTHLDACERCFPEYDFRRAYLKFMRRCASPGVPPQLRRRIFEVVLEEEAKNGSGGGFSGNRTLVARARHTLRRFLRRA